MCTGNDYLVSQKRLRRALVGHHVEVRALTLKMYSLVHLLAFFRLLSPVSHYLEICADIDRHAGTHY